MYKETLYSTNNIYSNISYKADICNVYIIVIESPSDVTCVWTLLLMVGWEEIIILVNEFWQHKYIFLKNATMLF